MKTWTTFLALLAIVNAVWAQLPPPERLTFIPAEKIDRHIRPNRFPQNPANHDFRKAPKVPLLPVCISDGYFRDPYNCGKFYLCSGAYAEPLALYCQPRLIFNVNTNACDYPENVQC